MSKNGEVHKALSHRVNTHSIEHHKNKLMSIKKTLEQPMRGAGMPYIDASLTIPNPADKAKEEAHGGRK